MSKYLAAFTPYEVKSSLIHITGYKDRNFTGYIENPYFGGERYFANLTQFLLAMELLCDDISYPQRSNENRMFAAPDGGPAPMTDSDHVPERGVYKKTAPDLNALAEINAICSPAPAERGKDIATFKLSIFFRQASSWQGSVLWLEKNLDARFRSVLELVMLMDSVLTEELDK